MLLIVVLVLLFLVIVGWLCWRLAKKKKKLLLSWNEINSKPNLQLRELVDEGHCTFDDDDFAEMVVELHKSFDDFHEDDSIHEKVKLGSDISVKGEKKSGWHDHNVPAGPMGLGAVDFVDYDGDMDKELMVEMKPTAVGMLPRPPAKVLTDNVN